MENNLLNDNINKDVWVRPWDSNYGDNLYKRDERFFSLVIKGLLSFLNKNIVLNGESIQHYIFNTGSSILYVENNGYEFSWCETSGEDQIYMKMPRCIVEFGDIGCDFTELTSPYVRTTYERLSSIDNTIKSYNAETRRLPIELSISLKYVLSTMNESLILIQELVDKLSFQKYFNFIYLGQKILCSIEFPQSYKIEFNKIDMTSTDVNQKNINLELKLCTNYPIINTNTEISSDIIIGSFNTSIHSISDKDVNNVTDVSNMNIE